MAESAGFTSDNEEVRLLMEVGYFYLDMGRPKDAREVFEGVAALTPKSEYPLLGLGSAYFHEKKFPQAKRSYESAIGMNGKNGMAQALLGETLIFMKQPDAARVALGKASALSAEESVQNFVKHLSHALDAGVLPLKPATR